MTTFTLAAYELHQYIEKDVIVIIQNMFWENVLILLKRVCVNQGR